MGTRGHAEDSFFNFPVRQFNSFQRDSNQRSFSFPLRGWSLLNVVLLVLFSTYSSAWSSRFAAGKNLLVSQSLGTYFPNNWLVWLHLVATMATSALLLFWNLPIPLSTIHVKLSESGLQREPQKQISKDCFSGNTGRTLRGPIIEKSWLFRRNKKLAGCLSFGFTLIFYKLKM